MAGETGGIGIGLPVGVQGLAVVIGVAGIGGREAGEGQGLQSLLIDGPCAGLVAVIIQMDLPHEAIGTAAEIVAAGGAAGGRGKAVGIGTGGGKGRGAVAAADRADVLPGEAAEGHAAATDLEYLHVGHGVALAHQTAVAAGEAAHQQTGIVAAGGEGGSTDAAGADGPGVIAHEAAHIQDAALIGVGRDGVARRSAVVDGAVIAACQSADIGGTQAQDAPKRHGVVLFPGGEHYIPQTTLIQAEESGVVAAVGTLERHSGDGIGAAVIDVGKGDDGTAADGLLAGDGGAAAAVVRPVVAGVVDAALLLEGGVLGQQGAVLLIVQAQVIQLPGRADADLAGGLRGLGALRYPAGEMGIEVVGGVLHLHPAVEVRGYLGGVHQRTGQGQQVVAPAHVDGVGTVQGRGALPVPQRIAHRQILLRQRAVHHAVAVARHRAGGFDGGLIGATEAVAAVGIDLVVYQCTGLELSLPVAVVGQSHQTGIGVSAQAHAVHQIIGHGVAAAGLSGEGVVEVLLDGVGPVAAAPLLIVGKDRAVHVVVAVGHIVGAGDIGLAGGDIRRLGGGVGELFTAVQPGAGAVTGVDDVAVGQLTAHQTRHDVGLLEAGGVAVPQGDVRRADAAADEAAGGAGGVEVAVGVGVLHIDGAGAADVAHQTAGAASALQHRGGEAVADGEVMTTAAHQTTGGGAADPDILLVFAAELVTGGAQVDLTALNGGAAPEGAGQTADIAPGADLGTAQTDVSQGAPEALEQAAVAVGIHRQLIDHRVIGLGAYGDGAVVIGEVLVIDGGEPPPRIAAVPAVVHAGVDELDILLLQRPCDGGGQTGALVQILQMPGIGDHGGGAAVPDLGKETVGGELASDGVHQTAVALYLHLQCQVGAGGQLPEAALLGEALALRQVVQHHGDGIGAVGDVDFGAGELHPPGGVALCVRHRHIEVQGVTGRVTGDLQQQTLLVDDLHLGGQLAGVLALDAVAAVVAHGSPLLHPAIP